MFGKPLRHCRHTLEPAGDSFGLDGKLSDPFGDLLPLLESSSLTSSREPIRLMPLSPCGIERLLDSAIGLAYCAEPRVAEGALN